MGASNSGPFDNDDAADWLCELEESSGLKAISAALAGVLPPSGLLGQFRKPGYLEAPECSVAIAAAEVVAALQGSPMAGLPENAAAWVAQNRELAAGGLVSKARAAVERVRTASELRELWEESGGLAAWEASLDDLVRRLG